MTSIKKQHFGTAYGKDVDLYILSNGTMEVEVLSYGATLHAIRTPDKNGEAKDVLLGYETVEEYQKNAGYLGAVIGRNCNRLAGGKFLLNGKEYQLAQNDGTNNLHAGPDGVDCKLWDMEVVSCEEGEKLVCSYHSPDMESGFPGEADIKVTYTLSAENELGLEYYATASEDTIMNLTNHAYFNLGGQDSGGIENHLIRMQSDFYTPVGDDFCPTGEVAPIAGTVFDFHDFTRIGDGIDKVPDFAVTGGYDHDFVLNTREKQVALAVEVKNEATGIAMEVYTNKPAVQFYAGNMLDPVAGKNGCTYGKRHGFCLETQFIPNCLTHPHLGSSILRKGEIYNDKTIYKFLVK